MSWNGSPRKLAGRRTIGVPTVPAIADVERPKPPRAEPAGALAPPPPVDRRAVQYLDRVRAIFRPTGKDGLVPGLKRFVGREDIFRHVGTVETAAQGAQPMMQCPPYWPDGARWVPIGDLEILEILEDQDVRAG